MKPLSLANVVTLALLLVLLVGVTYAMFRARASVLEGFGDGQAQQQWDQWRSAVERGNANVGPVERKVPRSDEPPTLVLMRDYFTVCLTGVLVLTALVYGTFAFLVRGVLSEPKARFNAKS